MRRHFIDVVTRLTVEQMDCNPPHHERIRYVTVGSGSLLTDWEILCSLNANGLTQIESIIAIDTLYDESSDSDHAPGSIEAIKQLSEFVGPSTRVLSFGSLSAYEDACRLEPHVYGNATTFIHCDAGTVTSESVRTAAAAALLQGGHLFSLSNLGLGVAGKVDSEFAGSDAHGSGDDPAQKGKLDESLRSRQYWSAQLRDGSSIEAWVKKPSYNFDGHRALTQIAGDLLKESESEVRARHERAKSNLSQGIRERAMQLRLDLYVVVFGGADKSQDGKAVPTALRNTVAVRSKPSRDAPIVSTRKTGDEVLVAEEFNGWVRLSEEDDEWGWQLASSEVMRDKEAWMLVDASHLGLGKLLERRPPTAATGVAVEVA